MISEINWTIYLLIFFAASVTAISIRIVYLLQKSRIQHEKKMILLRGTIEELNKRNEVQSAKIKITEDLNAKMRIAGQKMGQDIFSSLKDCVETLSENDLLNK